MTYEELYKEGKELLVSAGIGEADLDARYLLESICNTDRNYLLVHGNEKVEEKQIAKYRECIALRKQRIPLQHITGKQEFMGLEFIVNEHVLIPRQDTEILVEEVIRHLHDGFQILDMCTGSGCILLSLLKYSNGCKGVGVDVSKEALKVAQRNAKQLGINAHFIQSDLFDQVDVKELLDENQGDKFDIIVSNPPYIRSEVIPTLMEEVKEHEPMLALDGMDDGLYFYRKITEASKEYLEKGGYLFYEIGYDQGVEVSDIMKEHGFRDVEVVKDYAGLDRVVYGCNV
ncbi:MAG: peptide chain release factor N(5)-glutamine methyltransferase [Eubacteriales bacterium]